MDVVGVGAVAAAVAANVDAITTISCCDTSGATAAPTPSSTTCVLSTSSTTLPPPPLLSEVAVVGSEKISLPWDFAATELCRSCGRPQTELYELFDNQRSHDIDETNQNEEPSVSLNNSNEVIEDQHKIKMDILQEMQIWQLRIKQDDGYPQRICRKCRTQFLLIGKFRRKCRKVQIRLRELNEECRLEEEQQLLKRLDEKEILDIPPVLDIGHDLINDNYGQPLSEVELFETNWNATETTQNESLTKELMANDTDKDVRDDDELRTAEAENITIGCRVLHDIDLEVKANIDEESLLDTNSLFNTNIDKESLKGNEMHSQERAQILDNVTLEKNINTNLVKNIADEYTTGNLNCSYYVENTMDMLASNQRNEFSISENDNNLTKNAVEIISIENLGKIDLVPIISCGEEVNDLRILTKNINDIAELKHDKKEDYHTTVDNGKEKDCVMPEVKGNNDKVRNKNELENALTETGNIEGLSKQQQKPEPLETGNNEIVLNDKNILIKETKSELGTPHDCCLKQIVELRKSNRRHSDTTFVTKAALKAYDSHSSSLKMNEKMSSSDKSLIDKNEQLDVKASISTTIDVENISEVQTAAADKESKLTNATNDKPMHDNPKPTLIIPYAQKRRKKSALKMEDDTSFKQMHDVEMESTHTDSCAAKTRECSVRICRLNSSKLNSFVHNSTSDISTTEVASPQLTAVRKKRKNSNAEHNDHEIIIKTQDTETEELDTATVANKILKMESKNTPKKRLSWKTKAEMKATIDVVKLRKTSLRHHAKTKTKLQETDTMMVTSIPDSNKVEDHAKETNLKQVPNVGVEQSMIGNKIITDQADVVGNKNMDIVSVPTTVVSKEENKQNQAKQQLKNFILRRRRHERSSFQRERDCTNTTPVVNKIAKKKLKSTVDKKVSDCKNDSNHPIEINLQNTLSSDGENESTRTEPVPVSEKQQPKSLNLRRKQVMQVKRWRLGLRKAKDGNFIKSKDVETKEYNATEDKEKEIVCSTTKLVSTAIDEVSSSQKLTELEKDVEQATTSQEHNAIENKEKEIFCFSTNLQSTAIDDSVSSSQKLTEVKKIVKQATTYQGQQLKSRSLRRRKVEQMARRRPSFLRTIQCTKAIPVKGEFQKQLGEVDRNEAKNKDKESICKEKNSHSVATDIQVSMPQQFDETVRISQEVLEQLPIPQETTEQLTTEQSPQEVSETVEEPTSSSQAANQNISLDKLQVSDLNADVETAQNNAVADEMSTEDINTTVDHEQTQNLLETNKLIVRVPLTALTEEFQRMHFFTTNVQNNAENFIGAKETANVPPKSSFAAWNQNETENTAHALIKSNFCESAAAECSESAGALITYISIRATNLTGEDDVQNPNTTVCSQNESDLSEFYGFSSETDHSFEINSVGKDDEENETGTENVVLVSSQITDYINDFQTNCLTSNDVDDKSNTFPYDETNDVNTSSELKDEQNLTMAQIQTVRDINTHLSSNVSENDVESTLNGILNEIQDQHIFSSNTTLVTLESEDYHNHSAYSPLSDETSELQISQNDFLVKTMKNTLCDSADSTGPVVDPRQVEGNTEVNHPIISDAYATHFSKFVECFTEDSTQSELIGFQNDIPCFENIEMNSSTPRHNLVTPPLQMLSQSSITASSSTPLRITNSALQGAIQHGKNLEISFKNSEGNVQYLGITTSECDMADTMGLVCSTSSGAQMHTPSLNNSSSQTVSATFVNEQQANQIGKEYTVNNATMHLSQLFTEMHHPQVKVSRTQDANIASGSSQDLTAILLPDKKKQTIIPPIRSTKNSVLSKFVGSSKRLVYSKTAEAAGAGNAMLQTKKKLQFVTLPNDGQSTSSNAVTVSAPTEIGTLNIANTNLCTYAEMLQDVQWQNNAQDQQTTYYINASDLQQSNLISALVSGNISLVSSQISTTGAPQSTTSIIRTQEVHESNKQSVDANENYIEGMQNQSIMIVFPQELFKDSTTLAPVSTDYNSSQNITTLPVLNATSAQSNVVVNTPSTVNSLSTSVPPLSSSNVAEQVQSSVNLTCRFCHKRPKFTNNLEYSNHIIATHPAENPYNCPLCPMFFMRRVQRQQHVLEAHGSHRFQCAQCGQSFSMQRALDLHLQRFHVPDAPQQNLPKPRRKRMTRDQKQQQQQHQILNATPSCSSQQQQIQKLSAAQSHINPTSTWQDNASVQVNLEDVHLQVTDDDRTINEADNVRTTHNLNTPPHRILGCPECDDSFDDIADAESHVHQEHSHSPIATMPSPEQTEPDSTSTTTLRQFRKQRLSSKSFDDTPERILRSSHNCMFCEERFTNEIALRKHHQMAHNNESALPFVCSMCKRGFRMRTALQRHMDTHDSEGRPYECNVCRVRFPRPSQLTLHKLTVHFLKKPHTCNLCGKQFGTESALKTHAKFHGAHVKTHIPLGVYIEEDPPVLIREQKKLQQQPTVEQSATENLNSSAVDNPQTSS